jgi:hypothetical protein
MGLDMYLKRSKRVEGLTVENYEQAEGVLPWDDGEHTPLDKALPEIKGMKELNEVVAVRGESFKYKTIYEEVGYWRKANAIHSWFVKNCQDGIDECQLTEVSKEQLESLLKDCYAVVRKESSPAKTLPTQSGFFFGGTNYDQYYMDDIKQTISILEKTIATTDWDNQIVFYRSSW